MTQNRSRFGLIPAILGFIVLGTYLTTSMGFLPGSQKLVLLIYFAIGPVAIIGSLGIRRSLVGAGGSLWVDAGTVFLVVAFAFFNLMLVVQQYVRLSVRETLRATGADALSAQAEGSLRETWRVVDLVQQGIDVSFDIFYCLGLLLIAGVMTRHPDFGRFLGWFGLISATALLALNLGAFPHIPGESGLVDLGPLTGIWWVLVIIQLIRLDRRRHGRAPPPTLC